MSEKPEPHRHVPVEAHITKHLALLADTYGEIKLQNFLEFLRQLGE